MGLGRARWGFFSWVVEVGDFVGRLLALIEREEHLTYPSQKSC